MVLKSKINKGNYIFIVLFFSFSSYLFAQNQNPYVQILMYPANDSWDLKIGDQAKLKVSVIKDNIPLKNLDISYSYGLEGMPAEKSGTIKLKEQHEVISIGTLKNAGFKRCFVTAIVDGTKYSNMMTFAFSPELIKPTVQEPKDFDDFWNNEIKKMRGSKSNIKKIILEEYSTNETEVSKIHFEVPDAGVSVFGYLSKPKKDGKYPVLLYVPGAGIRASEPTVEFVGKQVINLSIEIHGLDPQTDSKTYQEISNAFIGYRYLGIEDKDNYYFKRVILACVKAGDYLCGLPEFDGVNFATYGGSQGGFLSIATAALHEKVSCLVSFHPAMSDVTGYLNGRVGGWPHLFKSKNFNIPEYIKTLSYFDTVNFAKRIQVPVFYSFGYNDATCPPTTCYAVLNSINAPKTLFITPLTGHWRIPEMMTKSKIWIRKEFKVMRIKS